MLESFLALDFWNWLLEPIPNFILFMLTLLVSSIMVTRRRRPYFGLNL
jgi:hypothetical protein